MLTEPKWFLGRDAYLKEITSAVSTPCLRKDFTVDEYMIYEAKLLGASAVLLICAILDDAQLKEYLAICDGLGLSALVEAHDDAEVDRALAAGARILGVNNRNLKDFTVDTANSRRLPEAVNACVGGGSNAIGSFYNFIEDKNVRLIGCEAAGRGIDTFETAATINTGRLGIFHGMKSYFCQDEYGQIAPVYSISAGLDYPGIGPEHAWLHDIGRAEYVAITDDEAVNAFEYLARTEGIIPAIESAHAVAHAIRLAPTMDKDQIIVITISGRGDKDCAAIAHYRGEDLHE